MKDGLINEYIVRFEELCRQAGYVLNSPNATRLFLQGLPRHAAEDVVRSPPVHRKCGKPTNTRKFIPRKRRPIPTTSNQRIAPWKQQLLRTKQRKSAAPIQSVTPIYLFERSFLME